MISNNAIRNCRTNFPVLSIISNEHVMGKVELKNIYQLWNGQSIDQIRQQTGNANPYSIRIGSPATDAAMKTDPVYFILDYLSYNPNTKDIETRDLIPYRNVDRVYIGQSVDEARYQDYRLFVDGAAVMGDLYLKDIPSLRDSSLGQLLVQLVSRVEKLQQEVVTLKRQIDRRHTYHQDESII